MAAIQKRVSNRTGKVTWRVDYRDAGGVRRAKSFKTRREADSWKTKAEYEISAGTHTPDRISVTILEAGELWIEAAIRRNLERSTVKEYRTHLYRHLAPAIGAVKLSRLTAPMVEQFADTLEEQSSRAMSKKILSSLRAIIGEAQKRGLISQNVATSVRRRSSSRDTKPRAFPTKEEIRTLIDNADECWRPFFITAIFTGVRASELRGLRWKHVNFTDGIVHVRERADQWGTFGPPKSRAGVRDIPLAPVVIKTLLEWRSKCPKSNLDLVFPNSRGRIHSQANIYSRVFEPLMINCGIVTEQGKPRFNFHALRHAAATLLIEQGLTPKRIQTIMGHSSITMTFDVYGHLWANIEADQKALKAIEKELFIDS